jgi:hypothetical protein
MPQYDITIYETWGRTVRVTADDESDAFEMAHGEADAANEMIAASDQDVDDGGNQMFFVETQDSDKWEVKEVKET